jgi:hypothetical protein
MNSPEESGLTFYGRIDQITKGKITYKKEYCPDNSRDTHFFTLTVHTRLQVDQRFISE